MAGETRALAEFASTLRYEDIPASVIAITKTCLIDTVGVALFGSGLPWSRSVEHFARQTAAQGASTILSASLPQVSAPAAALANGTFAHAFELDNLRQPSAGVHPGATAHVAALAVAQAQKASGRDFLTALVAACECMLRIGLAARQTSEQLGFHAPGLTGVFGSAIAASRLLGHDGQRTAMALGIGGSFCSGLLAFAKAGNGAMVKRLHMGRAAEGGVVAATLAGSGFEGPDVVLEGKFGFLDVYARDGDPALLVEGLGTRWDSLNIRFKMFPCHVTAQAPVRAIRQLAREHGFDAHQVARLVIEAGEKVLTHHADREPHDVGTAQYSVPFCVALALFRDPSEPQAFLDGPQQNPRILDLCRRIELQPLHEGGQGGRKKPTCRLAVTLGDGRSYAIDDSGWQDDSDEALQERVTRKYLQLTADFSDPWRAAVLKRLQSIERENLAELFAN
ncbi:MAG: MmgE/PrpD family protein [Xanthobacteraceae bacterium]